MVRLDPQLLRPPLVGKKKKHLRREFLTPKPFLRVKRWNPKIWSNILNYAVTTLVPNFWNPKKTTLSIFFGHTWGTSILTQPSNHPAPTPTKIQKKTTPVHTLHLPPRRTSQTPRENPSATTNRFRNIDMCKRQQHMIKYGLARCVLTANSTSEIVRMPNSAPGDDLTELHFASARGRCYLTAVGSSHSPPRRPP